MTLQQRKQIRKRQRAKRRLLMFLVLMIGFIAGVVFTVVLSQKYTVVISDTEVTPKPVPTYSQPVETPAPIIETEAPVHREVIKNKKMIVIDAGHQQKGNFSKEPIAPGASETKAKVAGGTSGVSTKIPEYQVTLEVSLLLEKELDARGYDVVMIRRTNDVNISNSERAMVANDMNADAFIRIHCNGSESSGAKGALTMCQTANNKYCGDMYKESRLLSECVIDSLCRETGAKNLGVTETDSMSGINWCSVPVTIVEMGFMTNPEEDKLLCDAAYQEKLAIGMANGIDEYFR